MREPEFIGGEVDLRINIYRGQTGDTVDFNDSNIKNKVPDSTKKVPDSTEKVPDNKQEKQIYEYVLKNGSITTAETEKLLGVKQRRARKVLINMVDGAYLRKEGAARSTIYVKNMEN